MSKRVTDLEFHPENASSCLHRGQEIDHDRVRTGAGRYGQRGLSDVGVAGTGVMFVAENRRPQQHIEAADPVRWSNAEYEAASGPGFSARDGEPAW